uniref:Uncharacterized protein n=1 Tax=Rhodococcus sp. NS1 TaxID=402236 RepID=A0A097SPQ8_9NOCA|nr:hypothetical protein LRS1606.81 [Rhodococcus sp. NS1]
MPPGSGSRNCGCAPSPSVARWESRDRGVSERVVAACGLAARSDRPHDQRTSRRTRPATCTVCRRVTSLSLRREREHGNDDPASSGLHGVDENDPRSDADEGAERSRGGGPDLGRWCEGILVDSSGEQRPDPAASRGWATGSGIVEVARSRSPPGGGDRLCRGVTGDHRFLEPTPPHVPPGGICVSGHCRRGGSASPAPCAGCAVPRRRFSLVKTTREKIIRFSFSLFTLCTINSGTDFFGLSSRCGAVPP